MSAVLSRGPVVALKHHHHFPGVFLPHYPNAVRKSAVTANQAECVALESALRSAIRKHLKVGDI